jgi:hypothetical protein
MSVRQQRLGRTMELEASPGTKVRVEETRVLGEAQGPVVVEDVFVAAIAGGCRR